MSGTTEPSHCKLILQVNSAVQQGLKPFSMFKQANCVRTNLLTACEAEITSCRNLRWRQMISQLLLAHAQADSIPIRLSEAERESGERGSELICAHCTGGKL